MHAVPCLTLPSLCDGGDWIWGSRSACVVPQMGVRLQIHALLGEHHEASRMCRRRGLLYARNVAMDTKSQMTRHCIIIRVL